MQKIDTLQRLLKSTVMAIVRVETIERAQQIVDGCLAGQIDCLEISYTNANASDIISQLNTIYENKILVGAGTVLDSETARLAILAGAKFIIAPNFNQDVARLCNRYQIPYMPGCTTYTEAVVALEHGASMIKAFPISNFYGYQLGSIFKTPLPYLPLMSSGGVTIDNITNWLESGVEVLGVGSLLTKGTTEEIAFNAQLLRQAVEKFSDRK
ncbi:hypothetical protein [Streptococcus ovis]|uniref:hypothetical protein n=1 Tax=Streptococcus ovis TaxID=82806 RepID=UPI00035D4348|nr:hypothetical protein [Streptococcus ovis]